MEFEVGQGVAFRGIIRLVGDTRGAATYGGSVARHFSSTNGYIRASDAITVRFGMTTIPSRI